MNNSSDPKLSSASLFSLEFISRPGGLLVVTLINIFLAESLIMLFLGELEPLQLYQEVLIDSTLLSLLVFPALYYFVFRPLHRHIDLLHEAEDESEKLVHELQTALSRVKSLEGIIPICSCCGKIRDDEGSWKTKEVYRGADDDAAYINGLCAQCVATIYPDWGSE